MSSVHPQWATKYKKKGTELRRINGRYYLYAVSSKYDPIKKRARKITGKLLGKITKEEGFRESEKEQLRKSVTSNVQTKEYGVSAFLESQCKEYETLLQKHFPDHWKTIIALAYGKLTHQCPLKNMEHHYQQSFLSEKHPDLALSSKSIAGLLREIGQNRERITHFFRAFQQKDDHILFDGTDLFSKSQKMTIPKISKSKKGTFESLVNIMFVFSLGAHLPVYYRILPGDIKDIKAFELCLKESQIQNAVVIIDKGFYSASNIQQLDETNLKYIIPLRRNNSLIDYSPIQSGNKKRFEGFFEYEGRMIWHASFQKDGKEMVLYLDEELRVRETKDYLRRTETFPEKYSIGEFHQKQHEFGTITLMNNLKKTSEEIYLHYKSRGKIEDMIDTFKNTLQADKSYMQNEHALEAWMLINFIALHWYYKIYQLLIHKKLTKKYAPMDIIAFLRDVRKVKMNGEWYTAEMTQKTATLLSSLGIHIP